MSKVSADFQLDFISYLQRLLSEGDFVATYKFALLNALSDICIESNNDNEDECASLEISVDELAEKFIELYWKHSLPFGVDNGESNVLLQNSGKQAALISQLNEYRNTGISSLSKLKGSEHWKGLISKTKRTIKEGPLWRLQILSRHEYSFLYGHTQTNAIILKQGVSYCFRRFYDLVVSISRNHWLQKIREIPANQDAIGGQGDLEQFLFGTTRNALTKIKPFFFEIQKGMCFYCESTINENLGEMDHFIPWSKYPNDLGHNFVLSCEKCNGSKSDHLASVVHYKKWIKQNLEEHEQGISSVISDYFICEAARSEAIAGWSYDVAKQNGSYFW
jgi:5-methylcytosine-specific restriction endonuclease McrA